MLPRAWSRVHRQRHVTTCLMKFAVGERNVAIRYSFLRLVVQYERNYHNSSRESEGVCFSRRWCVCLCVCVCL